MGNSNQALLKFNKITDSCSLSEYIIYTLAMWTIIALLVDVLRNAFIQETRN